MLFILTRCTRLLQFQKEKEPIDENSINKNCRDKVRSLFPKPAGQKGITSGKDSTIPEKNPATQGSQPDFTSHEQPLYQADVNFVGDSMKNICCGSLHEHNHSFDGSLMEPERTSDSMICSICEQAVPISHLESHSYICAYADKCALNCIDVDERLVKLAEILELIIESRNLNSIGSPGQFKNAKFELCSYI
ncbi:hypothetical protein V6N13_143972 [Hibiscus sabdariffa]|uniref:Uncharacterized protein n=1 Tax=Hibiscus sabdariffa TaxID=183260 RepID=A0ABR2FJH8_9ROSI